MRTTIKTAKALQKIKHIKQIKSSIKHHEATKAKKDVIFQQRYDTKLAKQRKEKYESQWTRGDIKRARQNYKEDWALGPLRPNRAVGENAELYGAMDKDQLRWPEIPIYTQRMKNKLREKAGLDPEWPIISEDEKRVYPFAKNDRVVIIRGKEMNKIGFIHYINADTHMVEIKDINKTYVDSSIFAIGGAPEEKPKREFTYPFDVNDLRLVVPMTVTELRDGRPVKVQQDVIVDKIVLERYTRGINPYTGVRSRNNKMPVEYQKDPKTNEPIYQRYIAGTRHLIDWPLEASVDDTELPEEDATSTPEKSQGLLSGLRNATSKILGRNKQPQQANLQSGLFSRSKKPEADETPAESEQEADEHSEREALYQPKDIPRKSLNPTPVAPPSVLTNFETPIDRLVDPATPQPDQKPAKLRSGRAVASKKKNKPITKPRILKTPQQMIWEYEARQRRKTTFTHHNQRPKLPVDLLTAIGMHMEKNGVKPVMRKGAEESEVD